MPPIRKLAFVVNTEKDGAPELARALVAIARQAGVEIKQMTPFPVSTGFFEGQDAGCVIGGDGTLLGAVREAVREQVPIIGVNRGSLGFLTTFSAEEARTHFADLLGGAYQVARRSLLECSTGPGSHDLALNDVLIKDEVSSRLVPPEVHARAEVGTTHFCDGLIFSPPTGSTAYNLSAGGPIIHPSAEAVVMTPICPHTLSNRAIIFRPNVRLRVYCRSEGSKLLVAMDGQRTLKVGDGLPVDISASKLRLPLAQRVGYSHFSVVRTKLKWSGGFTEGQARTS